MWKPERRAQRARCQAEIPLSVLFRLLRPALHFHRTPSLILANDKPGPGAYEALFRTACVSFLVFGPRRFDLSSTTTAQVA